MSYYELNKESINATRRIWRQLNPEKVRVSNTEQRRRRRAKVLEFLGNVCCKCGFDDSRALQIDHVRGGGSLTVKAEGKTYVMSDIYENPDRYQLLCANCNWIKRVENQEYTDWRTR